MAHNVENPADISYVSITSDPDRENLVINEDDSRLVHYCNCLELAVVICEILTAASLVLCAFMM